MANVGGRGARKKLEQADIKVSTTKSVEGGAGAIDSPPSLQPPAQFIAMPEDEKYYAATEQQLDALTNADKHFSLEMSLAFLGGILGFVQNVFNVISSYCANEKLQAWDLIASFIFAICLAGGLISFRYFRSEKSEATKVKTKILSQKAQRMPAGATNVPR